MHDKKIRISKKTICFFMMLVVIFTISINKKLIAGDQHWSTNGPFGGQIFYIVANPLNPSILYAGSASGVSKSIDGGNTWKLILSQGILNSEKRITATQIYLNPSNPNIIYVSCYQGGLYRSTNAGLSWEYLGFGTMDNSTWAVIAHPQAPEYIYVTTKSSGNNVFWSDDNGENWTDIGINGTVEPIVFDPFDPYTFYLGGQYGVFKRSLWDTTWVSISNGLPVNPDEANIVTLIPDNLTPGVLYAVSNSFGLYKTTDYGQNWTLINSDISSKSDWKLDMFAINPLNSNVLYAIADSYLVKSDDGGENWSNLVSTCNTFVSIEIDPINPDIIYVGDVYNGILKSTDGGITWNYSNNGLTYSLMETITLNPTDPNILYVGGTGGDHDGGFYKSADGGQNWVALNQDFTCKEIQAIAVNPVNKNIIWVGTYKDGLFKSTNGGESWQFVDIGISGTIKSIKNILIDPINSDVIYVTHKSDLYKTIDGGLNWFIVSSIPDAGSTIKQLEISPINLSTLYVSAGGAWSAALYKSTDGGETWTEILNSSIDCFALDPVDSLTIFYSSFDEAGMKKTIDGGQTWVSIDNGLGWFSPLHAWVSSIIIDPNNHNVVYAGLLGVGGSPWGIPGGVYKTINGGYSWEPMMEGLDIWDVRDLAFDNLSSTLYAAIGQGGIWSYTVSPTINSANIIDIVDIPDDQGKQVLIKWKASKNDNPDSNRPVTQYGIWRKMDSKHENNYSGGLIFQNSKELFTLDDWCGIVSIMAVQDSVYYYIAPTIADSNSSGSNYSTYMITAHTQVPSVWSASVPDSAYSLDNILPEPIFNLSGCVINNNIKLNWQAQFNFPDFSHFAIYRDTVSGFIPNSNNLIAISTENWFTDSITIAGQRYNYVVSVYDINGNESEFSNEIQITINGIDDLNSFLSVSRNYPNPFNYNTTIEFPVKSSNTNYTVKLYNINGSIIKTLADRKMEKGIQKIVWDGTDNSENMVPYGIYFCEIKQGCENIGYNKIIFAPNH